MKLMKGLIPVLAFGLINVALADNYLPARQMQLPFYNISINSDDHTGLFFTYNMNGNPTKKIVCQLSNIYKSWLDYRELGTLKESGLFGGRQTVILTSKGYSEDRSETISIYRADSSGSIRVNDLRKTGVASCYYEIENTP